MLLKNIPRNFFHWRLICPVVLALVNRINIQLLLAQIRVTNEKVSSVFKIYVDASTALEAKMISGHFFVFSDLDVLGLLEFPGYEVVSLGCFNHGEFNGQCFVTFEA